MVVWKRNFPHSRGTWTLVSQLVFLFGELKGYRLVGGRISLKGGLGEHTAKPHSHLFYLLSACGWRCALCFLVWLPLATSSSLLWTFLLELCTCVWNPRVILGLLRCHPPCFFFGKDSLPGLELTDWARLTGRRSVGFLVSTSVALGLQVCATTCEFFTSVLRIKFESCICKASSLPSELSPHGLKKLEGSHL